MSSNNSSDAEKLLNLVINNTSLYHEFKNHETNLTAKIRNSLNAILIHLVTVGGITEEDVLEGIKKREEACHWFTKMEHFRPKSEQDTNPENRFEINNDNTSSRFPPAPPPPSTVTDNSVGILRNTASAQATPRAAPMNHDEVERDHSALCEIIRKKLNPDQWSLKPKPKCVRKLFSSKEVKTKIRDFMIEHVQFGFHMDKSKRCLYTFLDCIMNSCFPRGTVIEDIVIAFLENCAGQTSSNFGSVIQLMSEVHEKYCSEECVRTRSLGRFRMINVGQMGLPANLSLGYIDKCPGI